MRPTRHDYAIMKYAQRQVPPASTINATFGFQRIMKTASKRIGTCFNTLKQYSPAKKHSRKSRHLVS